MKKLKLVTMTILLCIIANTILAQKIEIFVINETNSTFENFSFKISESKNWETTTMPEETDEYLQAFSIYVDTSQNCLIDFKANDGLVEYKWFKINLCNAIEVSLFLEDDGSAAYMVSYDEGIE